MQHKINLLNSTNTFSYGTKSDLVTILLKRYHSNLQRSKYNAVHLITLSTHPQMNIKYQGMGKTRFVLIFKAT